MNTTQHMSEAKKQEIFNKQFPMIEIIYKFGNCILREQIKELYLQIHPDINSFQVEFMTADLIQSGFLIGKRISRHHITRQIYSLNKYCTGKIEGKDSQSASFQSFTNQKIYNSIFRNEFIIQKIIPEMQADNYEISTENILTYLNWKNNTLLISGNQNNIPTIYDKLYNFYSEKINISDSFMIDWYCAITDQLEWITNNPSMPNPPEILYQELKNERNTILNLYQSPSERLKNGFNLSNLIYSRFKFSHLEPDTIHLYYFDSMESLSPEKFIEKLYRKLVYISLMFKRYFDSNFKLNITIYLSNDERKQQVIDAENKPVHDRLTTNYRDTKKAHSIYQNAGLLPSFWDDICVHYEIIDIYSKYNITVN